ncbi:hypothetical protein BC332_31191 [Capsicum chinense]|nr:hypothetical protein BC332_31191 [Capsicum chinense]
MPFFLTLWSVQTLPDPKVVDGIKIEFFRATTIIRKTILEGGFIVVDDGSRSGSGSGSGAAVGLIILLLPFLKQKAIMIMIILVCTDFSPDFSTSSEWSTCKSQDYKAKHNGVINAIMNCGPFIIACVENLSDGLQVPNDRLDAGLLRKRYAAILWKYREAKAQKLYVSDIKDQRRPKPNFVTPDEEQLVHID